MATIRMLDGKRWSEKGHYDGYKTNDSLKRLINYVTDEKKTEPDLIKGRGCSPQTAYEEFLLNKEVWGKGEDGKRRLAIHFTQSFAPSDPVTPEIANQIAGELIESKLFDGFQILYATHIDRDHIHTHFVVDTVNKESGIMWHISKDDLEKKIKDVSDKLCEKYSLSVCQKREKTKVWKHQGEDKAAGKGESWKEEIRIAALLAAETATSRRDFYWKLKELGVHMDWQDNHKYITFSDTAGHRIRHHRLEPQELFSKEGLEERFRLNRQMEDMERARQKEARATEAAIGNGIHTVLYAAKTLVQSAEQYPLQRHGMLSALGKAKTEAARKDYIAEQRKGHGL